MKKKTFKGLLLIPFLALPLFSCGDESELKPSKVEDLDKHVAVSSLGKAMKASCSKNAISVKLTSSKELKFSLEEKIHDSINNVDWEKSIKEGVATGVTLDYRLKKEEVSSGDDVEYKYDSSVVSYVDALSYTMKDKTSESKHNYSALEVKGYSNDDTYYFDPTSNSNLSLVVRDLLGFMGMENMGTAVTMALTKKYKASADYVDELLDKLGIDASVDDWADIYKNFIIEDEIDKMIVTFDQKVENWGWLSSYTDKTSGDYVFYANMNKADLVSFLNEMDPPDEGDSETYEEKLAGLQLDKLEVLVTFNGEGLKSGSTAFSFKDVENDVPFYETSIIPLPGTSGVETKKQTGTSDVTTKVEGGFSMTFGNSSPLVPSTSGWWDLKELISLFSK